jgi:hypothetical protein
MKCKKCDEDKDENDFGFCYYTTKDGEARKYKAKTCKQCDRPRIRKNEQQFKQANRNELAAKQRTYASAHKVEAAEYQHNYYLENKDYVKARVKKSIYRRRKEDIVFHLKCVVSTAISAVIKKQNRSVSKYLPYALDELKKHLENQFEPWMSWANYGPYRINTWNDDDSNTWSWHIDHIVPHSKFKYTSMEDDEFKRCWALSNLRPLSAKQNIQDGARR